MNYPGETACCVVDSVFGYTLRQGILIVCVSTIVISTITVISSIASICTINDKNMPAHPSRPAAAAGLLFALYCSSIGTYQIFISGLLLWNTVKTNGSLFACSMWYISHLSIIVMYGCFFIALTVAFFSINEIVHAVFTILLGLIYIGVFCYFCIVVNSYSYTINQVIYY